MAKACQNKRTLLVKVIQEVIKRLLNIIKRYLVVSRLDGIFVQGSPRIECNVSIKRRVETVAIGHVIRYFSHLNAHVIQVLLVADVGIMAHHAILCKPIKLPGRRNVKYVHTALVIVQNSEPHVLLAVVGCRRYRGIERKIFSFKKAKSINLTLVYIDTFFMAKKALQIPVAC